MNRSDAQKAISNFRDSVTPAIYNSNESASKGDLQRLADQIADLAEKLIEIASK